MSRYFDAQAALAEMQGYPIDPIHPIPDDNTPKNRTNRTNRVLPDTEIFEERAAIAEINGGLTRAAAEDLAAQSQSYENVVAFRAAQHRGASDE